jgi:hypothetical protein
MITDYQRFRLENEYDILKNAGLSNGQIVRALKALAERLGLPEHILKKYFIEKGLST